MGRAAHTGSEGFDTLEKIAFDGSYRKEVEKSSEARIFDAVPPPKNVPKDMATASVLSAAWWDLTESRINSSLSKARDERFAQRLRGLLLQREQSMAIRPPFFCQCFKRGDLLFSQCSIQILNQRRLFHQQAHRNNWRRKNERQHRRNG